MNNDNMFHTNVPRPDDSIATSSARTYDPNKITSQPIKLGPTPISEFPYVQRFHEITKEMADLYAKKNVDYGNSFAKSVEEFGLVAGLVRLSDKWNRTCELVTKTNGNRQVADESLRDTAIDGACYFIMLAMEIERRSRPMVSIDTLVNPVIEFGDYPHAHYGVTSNNDSITRTPQITC